MATLTGEAYLKALVTEALIVCVQAEQAHLLLQLAINQERIDRLRASLRR